jgi:hypothetical protein
LRQCTFEDFERVGIDVSDKPSWVKERICPQIEKASIHNGYSNNTYRESFSFEAIICTNEQFCDSDKSKAEILLRNVYFTLYYV